MKYIADIALNAEGTSLWGGLGGMVHPPENFEIEML